METNIYILKDPITNEVRYVGKSVNAYRRYNQHLYDKRNDLHSSRWIRKLQKSNLKPVLEIIETCNEDTWRIREQYWIKHYSNICNLTNLTAGGDGLSSYKHTDITKLKISNSHKGKKLAEKTKKKLSDVNKGKISSKESKDKQSISLKLFYQTDEGKKLTKILIANMNNVTKKAIIQLDLENNIVMEYESLSEAFRKTGFQISKISLVCNNIRKKAYGYKWKFK